MESELHSWKQRGLISIWRYTEFAKAFGGWHLSANDEGIRSLLQLVPALQAAPNLYRTLTITPPSKRLLRVPNYQQGRAKWEAPAKLQLRFASDPGVWELLEDAELPQFTIGDEYLPELIRGLEGIPKGDGDYSIGPMQRGQTRLWFWWWLDAA